MMQWNSLRVLAVSSVVATACAGSVAGDDASGGGGGGTSEADAGSVDDSAGGDTGSGGSGGGTSGAENECELPEQPPPPSCEACLETECEDAFRACTCDAGCAAQLAAMRACFSEKNSFDEPSDAPGDDWASCEDEVGMLGDEYFDVVSCVTQDYVPPVDDADEDPWGRTEGDGTCTAACFEVYSFDF